VKEKEAEYGGGWLNRSPNKCLKAELGENNRESVRFLSPGSYP
jgi:hypothetical protein